MDFDQVLALAGGFGRYQKTLYVWICLPQLLLAFHMMVAVFTSSTPPHHCRPPPTSSSSFYTLNPNRSEPIPLGPCSPAGALLVPGNRSERVGSCQHGWVYSNDTFQSTTVTEWDLVCDRAWMNNLGSVLYMSGLLVGSVVFGPLADRYGRRLALLLPLAMQTVFGVAAAFAPNFAVYVCLRFVVGATISGVIINAFVLGTEWTCTERRLLAGITTDFAFGSGYMLLAGLAYLIRDWRRLQLAVSAPGFLLLFYVWVVPQSARWLLSQERPQEAMDLLRKAALVNGRPLPPGIQFNKALTMGRKRSYTVLDLVKTPQLRKRTLILCYLWFVNVLVYYGLSLGVSRLGSDLYMTQFVFGVIEIPARALVLLVVPRGRRLALSGFLAVGGLACLLMIAVPTGRPHVLTGLALVGKFGITASFATIYIYTAEVFPTVVRQTGIGISGVCARVGGVLAPVINTLEARSPSTPLAIFGLAPLLGAALAMALPETAGRPLPDTLDDVEGGAPRCTSSGPGTSEDASQSPSSAEDQELRWLAACSPTLTRADACPPPAPVNTNRN